MSVYHEQSGPYNQDQDDIVLIAEKIVQESQKHGDRLANIGTFAVAGSIIMGGSLIDRVIKVDVESFVLSSTSTGIGLGMLVASGIYLVVSEFRHNRRMNRL